MPGYFLPSGTEANKASVSESRHEGEVRIKKEELKKEENPGIES
jgi:hypothetical protein